MVESTTASRTRVVAVAEVDGRRFPLLLLLRQCSSQLRWLRLIWEAVVLEKGTEGEGSVMVCFELAGRGALYRLDGGSSSAWAALGGDRATEGYWHGTRRRTVQRGWAVVKDVTAERGEVSIVHNVSMPGATVDGNPAISSSLQGTGEQGGVSGDFLLSWRTSRRWRESEAWSGCTGTSCASIVAVDAHRRRRGFKLAVPLGDADQLGGVVWWR